MLGSLFRREERAIQATPWGQWAGDPATPTWSGSNVDATTALQLVTVYGCVRLISDSIATLPVDVLRKVGDRKEQITPPAWLDMPVMGMHRVTWLGQVLSSLLLDGNAYVIVVRNPDTRAILELIPVDSCKVNIRREEGRKVVYLNGQPTQREILHIPGLMLAGMETGYSPVEAARQSIGLGMAAQEFGARFFGQGATQTGVIQVPGELPPGKPEELARQWSRKHGGKAKSHLPAVLEGGATWQATSITNEQAQFLETRGFTAAEIAGQMFLVDPSDLGIPVTGTSLTYANLEQRNARRVQVTLLPWIVRLEMALSSLLAVPRYVKFNVAGLLRGDIATQTAYYAAALAGKPWMLPDEVRELQDMDPLPPAEIPEPAAPVVASNGSAMNGVPANA